MVQQNGCLPGILEHIWKTGLTVLSFREASIALKVWLLCKNPRSTHSRQREKTDMGKTQIMGNLYDVPVGTPASGGISGELLVP